MASRYATYIFFCLFTSLAIPNFGQIEVEARYENNDYINWNNKVISDVNGISTLYNSAPSYGLGLRYFIQPDKERQMYYYGFAGFSTSSSPVFYYRFSNLMAGLGLRFFPFNMEGDCDCPSFYQEGNLFSRGFNLSLGASYNSFQQSTHSRQSQLLVDAQAGVKIPLGKIIAVQPFIGFVFGTGVLNEDLLLSPTSTLNQIKAGLQFSFQKQARR